MKLDEIISTSNIFTDEQLDKDGLIKIANACISKINTECGTLFPAFTDTTSEYTAIPKNWLLGMLNNYLSYGVKMNDTSLTEANMYLDKFYNELSKFKDSLSILLDLYTTDTVNGLSSAYVIADGFGGVYGIDTTNAINMGFFGNSGSNGGSF